MARKVEKCRGREDGRKVNGQEEWEKILRRKVDSRKGSGWK